MPAEIAIGSDVLLATNNLHLKKVGTRKLIPRWVGPCKVTARIDALSYRLDLPACMHQIHNVFHISLMKQYRSDDRTQPPSPPELVEAHPEWTVEQILDHKIVKLGNQRLIGWEGYGEEHNNWESAANAENAAELVQDYWLTLPPDQRLIPQ